MDRNQESNKLFLFTLNETLKLFFNKLYQAVLNRLRFPSNYSIIFSIGKDEKTLIKWRRHADIGKMCSFSIIKINFSNFDVKNEIRFLLSERKIDRLKSRFLWGTRKLFYDQLKWKILSLTALQEVPYNITKVLHTRGQNSNIFKAFYN